jgi:uncharacterized protein YbaR (Trm112 family)
LTTFYLCPKCRSQLMADNKIIISAKAKNNTEGLISLSPELGNYAVEFPPTLKHKKGDLLNLFCPVCHHNLASPKHVNLAMVILSNEAEEDFEIYFSQVVGEHSTIKMMGDHVDLYGEHSDRYQDLFNPRQMF